MIASVIVTVSNSNVDQQFDYNVPGTMQSIIKVGSRVKVTFGKADRTIMGYVINVKDETDFSGNLKDITEVLDIEPLISSNMFELAKYIKYDSVSPMVRILNMMIPKALRLKTVKYINVLNYNDLDADLAILFGGKTLLEYTSSLNEYTYKIQKEILKGNIEISYDAFTTVKEKVVDKYHINMDKYFTSNIKTSDYVKDVLRRLVDEVPLTVNEIVDNYELSIYMVRSLIKKGILSKVSEKESRVKEHRISIASKYKSPDFEKVSNTYQKLISEERIPKLWIPKDNVETELILIKNVLDNIEKGKNTLIITPDILSSYKYSSFIRKETKQSTLCINSDLSDGELLDAYNEIKKDKYKVYVSTLVGALYPYKNIGTIIMMNSENDNYFNDQSPRFDLKKVMIKRASLEDSSIIMHSLSPSIKEYCRGLARSMDYYIMVDNRDKKEISNVELIDLKEELLRGNTSYISERLLKLIRITKAKGLQSVLIINNKNYATSVICRKCGHVHKCPKCDLTLKYNKKNNQLICPACSYRISFNETCPACSTNSLRLNGIGIEKLEEELKEKLDSFNIVSIDSPNYKEFQDKLLEIENKNVDVIISTDTYSKSIYNKYVGLVAIINIDTVAMSPNYDAFEKAYNLLVNTNELLQYNKEGYFVIQTYNVDLPIIKDFITGDYIGYIKKEISNRKILKNEPFYFINRIFVKAKYEEMFTEADLIKRLLKELLHEQVFISGPTYNKTEMAAQLIIKHRFEDISKHYQKIYEQYKFSDIEVIFDKYPKYL